MSAAAGWDLRYPIGGLFLGLGVILAGFGFTTRGNRAMYAPAGDLNINLLWGVVMIVFGSFFLVLAAWARRHGAGGTSRLAMEDPEGRDIEARERELGLER
jgi:hypothetical protein